MVRFWRQGKKDQVQKVNCDENEKRNRPMLRNANINYSRGTFFVTIQAAFNKTIFGAIVGEKCVLNELGQAVAASLASLGERCAGVEMDEFVVMPNHVHFLVRVGVAGAEAGAEARHQKAGAEPRHSDAGAEPRHPEMPNLGFVVGRFKSWISKVYRDMVAQGRAVDVGATPWQRDYWDKLVATDEKLQAFRRYIRRNPAKWTRDRFGAVTSYAFGNIALLNGRLIGFVASQGACAGELKPRRLWVKAGANAGAEARHAEAGAEPRHPEAGTEARHPEAGTEARHPDIIISTFTSAQERAVFTKALKSGRRFVQVCPGGIPPEGELWPAVVAACNEGRGLLISPAPSGTGLNKQRAVWCNEYVLRNSVEVWAGNITPGHTLASLVAALAPRRIGVA